MFKLKRQLLWWVVLLVCLVVLGFASAAIAAPASFAPEDGQEMVTLAVVFKSAYVPDELLVRLKPGVGDKEEGALHSMASAVAVDENKALRLVRVKLAAGTDMKKAMAEYRSSALVEYVQPNYIYHALLVPNDPHYWRQWNMPKISAEPAWDITRGDTGVVVAVVDTGVDLDHPDLAGNVIPGYNVISPGGLPQDDNGHGTHVTGIVAAITDNDLGVAGVAGSCRIMPVKVLNNAGEGTDYDVATGIQWAADNGARIINMSLGGPDYSYALAVAVNYAYERNVLIIAAAGNDGLESILYPAALPHVMAVGATDKTDGRASFSNYGDALDIVAPGVNVFSTLWNNSYTYLSGTSMATPHVAGVAALVLSLHPEYTNDQAEKVLKAGCVDLGNPGWDPYYGYGRVDALAALEGAFPVGGTIRGQVYLEGRSNWSGAVVSVVGTVYTGVTAVDGTFVLSGLPPGIYDLGAGKESYLYRLCPGIEVTEGNVTDVYSPLILLAGDFSLDNMVDIDDLLIIRNAYGTGPGDDYWNLLVDVNQDGKIGIVDLVYMARNYAKYGQ
jgi:subtilisin family serine protease